MRRSRRSASSGLGEERERERERCDSAKLAHLIKPSGCTTDILATFISLETTPKLLLIA
jgi:hypothetical protein